MKKFQLGAEISLYDNLSLVMKRMANNVQLGSKKIDASFAKIVKKGAGIAKIGLGAAVAGIGIGMQSSFKSFVKFDDAMAQVLAVTSDGKENMDALRKAAMENGKATKFSSEQSANALFELGKAGFTAKQSIEALETVSDLSIAGQIEIARAVEIASDSLNAFGLSSKDAEINAQNLTNVTNVLAATATSSSTDISQIYETIKNGAASFTSAGQSIETFAALTGIMAQNSQKGERSGTALKNMIVNLQKPSAEAAKTLEYLGVNIADSEGNMRDALDILEDFRKGTKDMGDVQKNAAIATVFGKESLSAIGSVLQTSNKELQDYRKTLSNVDGATKDMASTMASGLGGQIARINSALIYLSDSMWDKFKEPIEEAVQSIIHWLSQVNIDNIYNNVVNMYNMIIAIIPVVKTMGATLLATALAIKVVNGAIVVYNTLSKIKLAMDQKTTFWTKAMAAAQWIYNAALNANPIGVIVIGITALIAGLIALWKNWEKIKNAWNKFRGKNPAVSKETKSNTTSNETNTTALTESTGNETEIANMPDIATIQTPPVPGIANIQAMANQKMTIQGMAESIALLQQILQKIPVLNNDTKTDAQITSNTGSQLA